MDCGDDKGYPTKSDAITALKAFRAHYELPKWTHVVGSGNGIHVYWILENSIPVEEWKPVANQLKQACVNLVLMWILELLPMQHAFYVYRVH